MAAASSAGAADPAEQDPGHLRGRGPLGFSGVHGPEVGGDGLGHHGRVGGAGGHAVHPDAGSQLGGEAGGQAQQRRLGRGVGGMPRPAVQRRDAADEDNPAAVGEHGPQFPGQEERPRQVDGDQLVEDVASWCPAGTRSPRSPPRAPAPPPALAYRVGDRADALGGADVGHCHAATAAELPGGLLQRPWPGPRTRRRGHGPQEPWPPRVRYRSLRRSPRPLHG